ncbi:hypothetical protein VE04_03361 [Pseudogymnoascus sp. 24MN13]|nr:hypothetical protein VE04_03361 [Pseudogymnoascus sp. 24MN13]
MNHTQESARHPPQPPINFSELADPTSVLQVSNKLCENLQQFVDKLVSTITPEKATFDNVVLQLLQHENEMQLTSNPITILSLVAPDTALRNAAAEASGKISHCVMDCKESNVELFRLIDAVYQRQKDDQTLDSESRKAVAEERRSYIRKGLGLSNAPIEEDSNGSGKASSSLATFRHNTRRLQTIQSEFFRNLDEKPHYIWLTRAELGGVPEDTLSSLEIGTREFDGKLKLNLNGMQARWMLTVASSPATRQKIYLESRRISKENIPLFHEAIHLRHQSALLLGYPSHLAFKTETTMAKTPSAVSDLLTPLRNLIIHHLPTDLSKLLDLKKLDPAAQDQPNSDVILWSDIPYSTRLYEERDYAVDQAQIAEYFPIYKTVSKMLDLFGGLFGFEFIELTKREGNATAEMVEQGLIWHPDVLLYSVYNDPQTGGNPQPSLLQHSDVVLLVHDLGHGIHDLSGRCRYSRFHGAETVVDFSEAPSQMLENWCWDACALNVLSGHYETGEVLPNEVIDSLLRTRTVLSAVKMMPQLKMTVFDGAVHSEAVEGGEVDVAKIYAECDKLGGIRSIGEEYGYATYRHFFTGSDAGMYGYIWSKVLAMDMFDAVFKKDPLDGEAGRRYRRMVLEKGGSQDEMETVVQFLGRRPTSEAFYKSLGLE